MHHHEGKEAHHPIAATRDPHSELELAVRELLIEKGLITAEQVRRALDEIDGRGPMLGARLIAKAWCDPAFRALLFSDARAAVRIALGINLTNGPELVVLEDTATVHHVIVCTLCSCYPKAVLGLPPDWYKSFTYRSRMVVEPRAILTKFGTTLPADMEIRVVDSTADMRYLVLPLRPAATADWNEDELVQIVTRDCMIGVTLPQVPAPASTEPT